MPENKANNKRIAKNTMFLYFRMIIIMGVMLYTSRVILNKLGVEDYGLYQVVGGVVGMLSFLNGTLSIGTSRFLTYELGAGDDDRLKRTFTTALCTHLILSLIIIIIMETGGLWFLYNKLIIPPDRFDACFFVFQISIATTVISITQVPYTSVIMAHERMGIYAYISIFEALAKLGICYLLSITSIDKLIFYAILLFIVHAMVAFFYRIYSINRYRECHFSMKFDKNIFTQIVSFSGWNIMANITESLKLQGIIILINMFFAPTVVAAQAIANQVAGAMMQFVSNFRTAINPQIIKQYAAGDFASSKKLTLQSTIYCFDLVLIIGIPAIIVMKELMHLWLVEVPPYAVIFTQWIIVRNIISVFSASFYIPMMAANKIKTNSIAAFIIGVGEFFLLYVVLKLGAGVMWVQYMSVIMIICASFLIKPIILYREINYSINEIAHCFFTCLKITMLTILLIIPFVLWDNEELYASFIKVIGSLIAVSISAYLFLDAQAKQKINKFLLYKLTQFLK